MTTTEKKQFIRQLSNRIRDDLIAAVKQMPKEWDGHELRCLLAQKHGHAASISLIMKYPNTPRAKSFHNLLLITNIV